MFISGYIKKVLLPLALAFFITGCAVAQPKTPEQIIQASSYPEMTKSVMDMLKNKKYNIEYENDRILVLQNISREKGHIDRSISVAANEYLSLYDSSNDDISNAYINTAKQKGNVVKMYKTTTNLAIVKLLPMPWNVTNYPSKADLDVAFLEYDKNNRLVSALVRVHDYPTSIGIMNDRYSIIVYGPFARQLEATLNNAIFSEGFITTIN